MAGNDASRFGRLKKIFKKGLLVLVVLIVILAGWLLYSLTRTGTSQVATGPKEEVAVSSSQDGDGLDRVVTPAPIKGERIVGLAFTEAVMGIMEQELGPDFRLAAQRHHPLPVHRQRGELPAGHPGGRSGGPCWPLTTSWPGSAPPIPSTPI